MAAPFGFTSAYLEKLGVGSILGAPGKNAITRITKAGVTEGATEFAQSGIEYTGGAAGTNAGWSGAEALDQSFAGAVGGVGMGAGLRAGGELTGAGLRAIAPGKREQADATVVATPADEASPIPTDVILEGRRATARGAATSEADRILRENGVPDVGRRVTVTLPGGQTKSGRIADAFDEDIEGERSRGVIVDFDDGTPQLREHFDTLADAGVQIAELSPTGEADAIDAQLSAMAQAGAPQPVADAPLPITPQGQPTLAPTRVQPAPSSTPVPRDNSARATLKAKIGRAESPNDHAKNPKSSATGRYQFVESTFKSYYRKVFGGDAAAAQHAWNTQRTNGELQEKLMDALIADNARDLARAGVSETAGNMYLAHFAGSGGAIALHRANPNASAEAVLGRKAVNANTFLRSMTASDVINWASKKMGGPAAARRGGGAAAPSVDYDTAPDWTPTPLKFDNGDKFNAPEGGQEISVASVDIPARYEDREEKVSTATGREVSVKYAAVEARDLIASNNADGTSNARYPATRQPRNRTRAASVNQVTNMAQNLKPYWLGRTFRSDDGAPVVDRNGVVESGNGRVMALQQVYETGGEKADEYRRFVESQGIDTSGMESPVLVRVRQDEMTEDEANAFAREANMSSALGMAPSEQAMADAEAISDDLLIGYQGGDIDAAANRGFVRNFMSSVMSTTEAARLQDAGGAANKTAHMRIRNALLARAFDNPVLVENLTESLDSNIVAIGGALTDVSGEWSQMRAQINSGAVFPEYDITANINEAVGIIDRARRDGVKVADLVAQGALFTGDSITPETEMVLRWLFARPDFTKPAGRARIVEALRGYMEAAQANPANQSSLLGDSGADVAGAMRQGRVRQAYDDAEQFQPAEQGVDGGSDSQPQTGRDDDRPAGKSVPQGIGEQAGTSSQAVNPAPAPAEPETTDEADMFGGPSRDERREALERRGDGGKSSGVEQRAPGSDGGLFDTEARNERQLFDAPVAREGATTLSGGDDIAAYVERAKSAQDRLNDFGKTHDGWHSPGIKSAERIAEKMRLEGYASPEDLKDVARGAFIVGTQTEADVIATKIRDTLQVVEDKGFAVNDATGYADHKIIVQIDGIKAEIQIVPRAIWDAKKSGAGKLYNQSRIIEAGNTRRAELEAQQRDIYAAALDNSWSIISSNSSMSASGNVRSNQAREPQSSDFSETYRSSDLSANPGANTQRPPVQTNAMPSLPARTMQTGRPSISPNVGVTDINSASARDVAREGEESNNASTNKLVSEDRAAELRARLREKLNPNRINSGIDPEILAIGAELAVYHIEKGARRFAAFSRAVADDLGMQIGDLRRYLRGWYNGARDMMEDAGHSIDGMDSPDEVRTILSALEELAPSSTTLNDAVTDTQNRDTGDANGNNNPLSRSDARESAGRTDAVEEDGRPERTSGSEEEGSAGTLRTTGGQGADDARRNGEGPAEASGNRAQRDRNVDGAASRSLIAAGNWTIEPGSLSEKRGPAQKARDNIEAIRIVKQLADEGRKATREEQAFIARYVGWGGLKGAFPDSNGNFAKGFEKTGADLQSLLTEEEYATARRSIQYAHYTAEQVVRRMWTLAERLGFKGGRVFEPGMGTGNFAGMMPADIAARSQYEGVEFDHLTHQIAASLYPDWGVRRADYTETPALKDQFDIAIGNPPFSATVVKGDPVYGKLGFVLHDFFFAKSLDAVKPGGLLMFVASAGTMNKRDSKAREWLAERADLVGAIRLPSTAFAENARTEVTTDIIVLRKRLNGEAAGDTSWTGTDVVPLPSRGGGTADIAVNRYFLENPDMVLGEAGAFDTLTAGERYGVRARAGVDLATALDEAIERISIARPIATTPTAETVVKRAKEDVDFSVAEAKEGSFYLSDDGRLMQKREGVGIAVQQPGKGVKGGISAANQERIRKLLPIRDALRETLSADLSEDGSRADTARARLNNAYDAFVKEFGPINKLEAQFRRPSIVQQESARAKARESARENGLEWNEGSFDATDMYDAGATMQEIASAREAARKAAGKSFDEGSFDPAELDDVVIEKRPNIDAFMSDQEGYRLRSIEHYNEATGKADKGLIFSENVVRRIAKPQITSANDAHLYVMAVRGKPDIEEVARLAGVSKEEALAELSGRIFRVPGSQSYESREAYLSGDVLDKLAKAREAQARGEDVEENIAALEAAQPAPLSKVDISANIGMPWIPGDVVASFASEVMGIGNPKASYNATTARWTVGGYDGDASTRADWGTADREPSEILWDALSRNSHRVMRKTDDGSFLDAAATQAVADRVTKVREAFSNWIWQDEARTSMLEELYNSKFNNLVAPEFDGSYLTTPGINANWRWRPHQSSGIARVIQTGNTYLAHGVGAGKTSLMIGAGMEMKRLGLVNKPMYAVPNHMLAQFSKEFYEQYPSARVMIADETRFHTNRRKQFVADVANSDIDAVIITHNAFGLLPMSEKFEAELVNEQLDELRSALNELGRDTDTRITRSRIEQMIEQAEQRLSKIKRRKKDGVYTFEETGVDFLFVDEAHLFRKLAFTTRMSNVKGIDPVGSQASFDLYSKVRYLDARSPGRSVVLASGTPVTNTMAELFSVQRYLQRGLLGKRGLDQFDSWASSFGDTVTSLEQDPAGGYKYQTRFARFVNVPELSAMVRQVMDVVTSEQLESLVVRPSLKGGQRNLVAVEMTPTQQEQRNELAARMAKIQERSGPPASGDDILLSVINDGRKGAIDPRAIDKAAPKERTKLEVMIDNVERIWRESKRTGFHAVEGDRYSEKPVDYGPAAQMVFADLGVSATPASRFMGGDGGFSVHDYIKSSLIARGIPAKEIANIADFKNAISKQRLFNDMNSGKVRVLIGSVPKMGTGVNAQKRLIANHNLDPQWYPANDEQRNGRIIRQGNMIPEVEIYDYSTKGSYDSQMWELMAKKARFIEGFFRGDPSMRDMEDLGEASQYEQARALTTADPRLIELTEKKQTLDKLRLRRSAHERDQATQRRRLADARSTVARMNEAIPLLEADIAQRVDMRGDNFSAKIGDITFTDRAEYGGAIIDHVVRALDEKKVTGKPVKIGDFGGFPLAMETTAFAGEARVDLVIQRNGGVEEDVEPTASAVGIVQSLWARLAGFERTLEKLQGTLRKAQSDVDQLSTRGTQQFPAADQAEIERLQDETRALEEALAKEAATDQAKADAKESREDINDLFTAPEQPARAVTERQRSELDARAKQGMARRGGQVGLGDQEGGLFASERDQGSLFRRGEVEGTDIDTGALTARLRALGLQDKVALQIVDAMESKGAAGSYQSTYKLITLARNSRQGAAFTLDHESVHAMRDLGLFTKSEWLALKGRALSDGDLMKSVRRRYADLDNDGQIEEAVADLFARWSKGRAERGIVQRLFDRIRDALDAIRSAFTGGPSAERVMRQIEAGNVGTREITGNRVDDAKESREADATYDLSTMAGDDTTAGRAAEAWDRFRTAVQDRYLPLLNTQRVIEGQLRRPLTESENPYLGEELMTGRIGARLETLTDDMIEPLFAAMHQEKVTIDELETYLYARHAQERNARIAEINPSFDEGTGSGMTDLEAVAIINRIERAGKTGAMQRLAARVDAIRDWGLDQRVESGLMSQSEVDAWRSTYENYVPLRGQAEVEGDATGIAARINKSRGINVRGKESRRAYGRKSKADNILAYTLLQAQEAVSRAETNKVAQQFVRMAEAAPDADFWEVNKITRKPVLDGRSGLVRYEDHERLQPEDKDFTVTAKFNGEERRVTMNRNNPTAARLADSMRNLSQAQTDWVVRIFGSVNRFLSAVNTSYNPEFVITNAFRDIQAATINAAGLEIDGLVTGTLRDYRAALVGSFRGAFKKGEGEWGKWYDEFKNEGGRVYFNNIDDLNTLKKRVLDGYARADGKLTVKRALINTRDFVEGVNLGVENAIRLSAYKNARELGMSKSQAASLAKNLTVNFNRRGTYGPAINAAYLFFNASVQGTARILTAAKSKRVRKMLAGIALGGLAMELLNAMLSDDDDDGESYYDKISDFDKSRNIIIMLPGEGGKHIKIPMPYGYNAFWNTGRTVAEVARRGGDRWQSSAGSLASSIVDAFNPVGGTSSILNLIAPTIADPIVDLERNRDYADRPIMPDQNQFGPETPDSQRYWGSVAPHWRALTDALTSLTGGDDVVAGAIDVSPETLEHLSGVVTGAAGAFIDRMTTLGTKALDPEAEVETNDWPFMRKVVGSKPGWFDKSAYYDRSSKVEQAIANAKDYAEREEFDKFDTYVDANPKLFELEGDMKAAKKEMRSIRKARNAITLQHEIGNIDDTTYFEEKRLYSDAEKLVVDRFNARWNAVMYPKQGDKAGE